MICSFIKEWFNIQCKVQTCKVTSASQTLLNRLETEKSSIQAEIEAGRHLQKDKNAPAFIHQYLAELDKKWKDTNELAKAKLEKLKVS